MKGTRDFCGGCRNNFYNGNNTLGVAECWSLKTARVVRRWRQHWNVPTPVPGALVQIRTNSCHHAPGHYLLSEQLPGCAVRPVYLPRGSR